LWGGGGGGLMWLLGLHQSLTRYEFKHHPVMLVLGWMTSQGF